MMLHARSCVRFGFLLEVQPVGLQSCGGDSKVLCVVQLCERLPSPNGESTVDCNSLSSMPKVAFTIAGKSFELSPEEVSIFHYISYTLEICYLVFMLFYCYIVKFSVFCCYN